MKKKHLIIIIVSIVSFLLVCVLGFIFSHIYLTSSTSYVENAKKNAFIDNAKMAIRQARNELVSNDIDGDGTSKSLPSNEGECIEVSTDDLYFEKELTSPFSGGGTIQGIVQVCAKTDGEMEYKFMGKDANGNGICSLTKEEDFKSDIIKKCS